MKTIGLIGGMSWESSALYYRHINTVVRSAVGGNANARSLMLTLNFASIEALQHQGDWEQLGLELAEAAVLLERGGADCIVLCTNTMHKVAESIESAVSIPMLHIVDSTAAVLKRSGVRRVGLVGTRFTMEDAFYQDRMKRNEIEVEIPNAEDRLVVHSIIYDELCQGRVLDQSRVQLSEIISRMRERAIQGIVLGCTELCLLALEEDGSIQLFDSTRIHAEEAAHFCLGY